MQRGSQKWKQCARRSLRGMGRSKLLYQRVNYRAEGNYERSVQVIRNSYIGSKTGSFIYQRRS